jgi:hypothetical protein
VTAELGNADIEQLQFKAIEAKVGAKLGASYTLEAVQIDNLDPVDGRSRYTLTIEGEVGPGIKLGEFLEHVGLDEFVPLQLTFTLPLGESPTGSVTADRASYLPGERVTVRVRLDPASTRFPAGTLYNVNRIVVLRQDGPFSTQALATQSASGGQTDFTLAFDSPGLVNATDLFAFVVPRFLPLDPPKLEIGRAQGLPAITVVTSASALLSQQARVLPSNSSCPNPPLCSIFIHQIRPGDLYPAGALQLHHPGHDQRDRAHDDFGGPFGNVLRGDWRRHRGPSGGRPQRILRCRDARRRHVGRPLCRAGRGRFVHADPHAAVRGQALTS